jgi:hypothetical protein
MSRPYFTESRDIQRLRKRSRVTHQNVVLPGNARHVVQPDAGPDDPRARVRLLLLHSPARAHRANRVVHHGQGVHHVDLLAHDPQRVHVA